MTVTSDPAAPRSYTENEVDASGHSGLPLPPAYHADAGMVFRKWSLSVSPDMSLHTNLKGNQMKT